MMMTTSDQKKKEEINEKSLFLFFAPVDDLQNVLKNYKLLKTLKIIGQNVNSLKSIGELAQLEELWIVQCDLQQETIEPICGCNGLKRLYLYDNELTHIPDLTSLKKLSHLWLSDNNIRSLQNLNVLTIVKELYLSNNKISNIDVIPKNTLRIVFLNLAGNPISDIKEIQKFESLRKLRWLVLSDPLFRTTPVILQSNYRALVIHSLPNLEKLDMRHISESERKRTVSFFDTTLQYYRLSLHEALSKIWSSQKASIDQQYEELGLIWTALNRHGYNKLQDAGDFNNLRFWEGEANRWKERLELHQNKFQQLSEVITQKINLEVENCGNISFIDVDLTNNDTREEFKKIVNPFLCIQLKLKVIDLILQNVWVIRGPHQNSVLQSQFQDNVNNVFIISPVQDLSVHPLKLVENILTGKKAELCLTDCLSQADPLISESVNIHRQLLLRSQALLCPRLLVLCGITETSQLIQ